MNLSFSDCRPGLARVVAHTIAVLLLICGCSDTAQHQTGAAAQTPDTRQLRVTATGGLIIRSDHSRESEKAGFLEYDERADILDDKNGPEESIDSRKGKWVKIRAAGIEGWIFDAYAEYCDNNGDGDTTGPDFFIHGACVPLEKRHTYNELKALLPGNFKETVSTMKLQMSDGSFVLKLDKLNYDYVLSSVEYRGKKPLLHGIRKGMQRKEITELFGPPARSTKNSDSYSHVHKKTRIEVVFDYSGNKLERVSWLLR